MGNILKNIIILIICFFVFDLNSDAKLLDSDFLKKKIEQDITQKLKSSDNDSKKISIEFKKLKFKSLNVPDGDIDVKTSVNSNYISPYSIITVKVFCDKKAVKTFRLPIKLTVKDKVWVAKDSIERGRTLGFSNVCLEYRDITRNYKNVASKDFSVIGNISRKNLKPGTIIDKRFIKKIPAVLKNSFIYLVFESSKVKVTLPGEALQDGGMGDYIKVRNKSFRKRYIGKVIGKNKVLISL